VLRGGNKKETARNCSPCQASYAIQGQKALCPHTYKYRKRLWTRMNKTIGAIAVLYLLIIIKSLLSLMSQMAHANPSIRN